MKFRGVKKAVSIMGLGALASIAIVSSAQSQDAFSSDSQWMLGDWGGVRTGLGDQGYTIKLGYVSEMANNTVGGYNKNKKVEYADQFVGSLNVDLEKVAGLNSAELQVIITNRNGRDITRTRIDDPRSGQLGSNMEVVGNKQIWRLSQFWYRQRFFDEKLDVKLGRGSPTEDFQEFPCEFQDVAFCAAQAGVWAADDWFSFNTSQWGARVRYNLSPEWAIQAGVYEHNRSMLDHENGFKMSTSGAQGVILPVEAIWKPERTLFGLPGQYRVGAYRMNIHANDVYADDNGQPFIVTGAVPKEHDERKGVWFMTRQQALRFDNEPSRTLEVFFQAHANDRHTSYVDRFFSAGVIANGPIASRPHDQLAFAVARIHVNDRIRDRQIALNGFTGASAYDDPAFMPLQGTQYDLELNYRFQVTPWLGLRPTVQFVHNPGAVKQVDDALLLGLKTEIQF